MQPVAENLSLQLLKLSLQIGGLFESNIWVLSEKVGEEFAKPELLCII